MSCVGSACWLNIPSRVGAVMTLGNEGLRRSGHDLNFDPDLAERQNRRVLCKQFAGWIPGGVQRAVAGFASHVTKVSEGEFMNKRANALAERLEIGALALANLAAALSEAEWQTRVPHDGRKVGVIVHHVGSVYPLEIQLAQTIAAGEAITGVTWEKVHEMNAEHALKFDDVTKAVAMDLLRRNSMLAAASIRELSDDELDRAAPVSLYSNAPLTCQFFLEDHAVRHSYHHLALIRATLKLLIRAA